MSADIISNAARGIIFGAALTASGVYLPSVIVDQMRLQEFHMMKAFLTTSASSALLFPLFKRAKVKPRSSSNLGWLGPYDGNIIGGLLMGAGMALTGACPGTVYVQVASGIASGIPVLLGGLAGGVVFVKVAKYLKTQAARDQKTDENNLTVSSKLNANPEATLLVFEGILLSAILAAQELQSSPRHLLNPIIGGLCIASAQLASLALYGQPLGISGSYEEVGNWFWYSLGRLRGVKDHTTSKHPSSKNLQFGLSIMIGTYLLQRLRPDFAIPDNMPISNLRGFLGGFVMIFGARLGGGCTSGHGITGMSMLSVSSIISVAAMFAGGIGLATLFG